MKHLFQNVYEWGNDLINPADNGAKINAAITLHPLKNHRSVYTLHKYLNDTKAEIVRKVIGLYRTQISYMDKLISNRTTPTSPSSGTLLDRNDARHTEEFWIGFNSTGYFSREFSNPDFASMRHKIHKEHAKIPQLKTYVRKIGRKYNYALNKGNVLYNLRYGYLKLYPHKGVVYLLHMHAKRGKRWIDKQYVLQQKFSNVGLMEENFSNARINVITPISGRNNILKTFLDRWESEISKYDENVSLTFVVMEGKNNQGQFNEVFSAVRTIKTKYPSQPINVLKTKHFFQKAYALQKGAATFGAEALLFFLDIDCSISRSTFHEIRMNTIPSKQVYFPVVFSMYNPKYKKINISILTDSNHTFSYSNGYWRIDGFGMFSIYKSDFKNVGGLNTYIKGWGNEDVDFLGRVISKKISVFRAPSLGLIHMFHTKFCSQKLTKA